MDKLHAWLLERDGLHPPESLMGTAVRYALNNWTELTRFLHDARIAPDNNRSEAALRVAAGRTFSSSASSLEAADRCAGPLTAVNGRPWPRRYTTSRSAYEASGHRSGVACECRGP